MQATKTYQEKEYTFNLLKPLDISLTLRAGENNPIAWYLDPARIEPVRNEQFTGSVAEGGAVNFRDIYFNPHGHGTHTECVGHIATEVFSINKALTKFFFMAEVVSIEPQLVEKAALVYNPGDYLITRAQLSEALEGKHCEAIIIRTLPNDSAKAARKYSGANPPYMHTDAMALIRELDIKHVLIDLPSVDPERDDGKLLAHHEFWNYPAAPRMDATISELIFVPDVVADGTYLLNLQIASFENDAAPSKPVLYPVA